MLSSVRSEAALAAELPVPIEIRPMRSSRRLRLRFDEAKGTLRLTCPARMSRRKALAWVLDQRTWIDEQLARAALGEPFADGAVIPVEGWDTRIVWSPDGPRWAALADGELRCGGPQSGLARQIERFLRKLALDTMSAEVAEFAAIAGVQARGVSIGDAGTRWGSCSSRGGIRLSWRLILAAPAVRRYVVAHEVAHLAHLNHGAEFKALEARLVGPEIADAKAALRREGPRLRRVGRGH